MLCACTDEYASSDAGEYKYYLSKTLGADKYMPDPYAELLGEYASLEATYKHSRTAVLYELDTVGLFLTYGDADSFGAAVEALRSEFSFYEKYPDEEKTDFSASVNNYDIVMVEAEYELEVYQSAFLVGVNEEEMKICYLFYYDFEMDSLSDLDGYIEEHFYLK